MQYTSFSFVFLFLPAVLAAYYLTAWIPALRRHPSIRKIVLVIASIGFYCLAEPQYWLLVPCLMVLNLTLVRLADNGPRFSWLRWVGVGINLAFLAYCKYISGSLPLGISFFTFLAISYDVDSRMMEEVAGEPSNERKKKPYSMLDAALYLCFFASIITGPVTRFRDECSSLKEWEKDRSLFLSGLFRFMKGYVKKTALADILAYLVTSAYSAQMTVSMAWLGAIAYSLQLYYDFSGYSDMAIGMGQMFGIRLAENFNYPYAADSISDFWHRWHMSLTKWFTTYVYIPLGGNRVSRKRHFLNLLIVWILTGLWHGNGWTFLLWAMIHFLAQYLEKVAADIRNRGEGAKQQIYKEIKSSNGKQLDRTRNRSFGSCLKTAVVSFLKHGYTLIIVITAWSVFQSENISVALYNIRAMFHIGSFRGGVLDEAFLGLLYGYRWPLLLALLFSFPIFRRTLTGNSRRKRIVPEVLILALFCMCVLSGLGMNYTAALYAGF